MILRWIDSLDYLAYLSNQKICHFLRNNVSFFRIFVVELFFMLASLAFVPLLMVFIDNSWPLQEDVKT